MKLRKILYIFITLVCAISVTAPLQTIDAKKAKTTQSKSGKKSKSNKKSNSKSSSKSSKNSRNKSRRSNNSKKSTKSQKGKYTRSKSTYSQPKEVASNDSLTLLINSTLVEMMPTEVNPGGLRVNLAKPDAQNKRIRIQLNENFTYLPINKELISNMEKTVKKTLPDSIQDYSITLNVGSRPLTYYISTIDKLPEQYRQNKPFVVTADPYVNPRKGMEGDIVALWHSHGRYYKNGAGWAWQRPFLFDTAEDIYTMSYVLPFLVPMLENAGAYVMLPRERDINVNEVIVDNDQPMEGEVLYSQSTYFEADGSNKWETGELEGFVYDVQEFHDTENPFESGTYRQVQTIKGGKASTAGWFADIPEDGEYAVYIGYKSLPNSSEDARYTVNYDGGSKEFIVNQKMGGGTWIYLGTFPLRKGYNENKPVVALSNVSSKGGNSVVTADAVKIGGGMGNIGRSARRSDVKYYYEEDTAEIADDESVDDESEISEDEIEDVDGAMDNNQNDAAEQKASSTPVKKQKGPEPKFTTSKLPRFLEGARYWLHWAGMPEYVYSPYHGNNDYKDDYTSRGLWVNYLAGGSRVLPNADGLGIPVDISFALHTDAGKRGDDSVVGTLGIYYTDGGKLYADGTPRMNSRILTDMIMRQVTADVRQTYEPRWTRRSMWDKSYLEAKTAQVPTTLLELLSHQNFGDMQYGLDPTFRFAVSRAIYKAMGRFISERKNREFIVQPLPVENFAIEKVKKGAYRLSWQPTEDKLEPTAKPSKYIIMERKEGNMGFVKIGETGATHYDVKVNDNNIHSYYIIAANEGGVSFPSEILSLKESGAQKPILIVNGFTRISGPKKFSEGGRAGFKADEDFGVPYKYDLSFSGYQHEFSRGAGDGFGKSGSNHVTTIAGGNTFDYPLVHGEAIASTGRGFISTSVKAVEDGKVKLTDFSAVDLILGKQKSTVTGNGMSGKRFEVFPKKLQEKLKNYVEKGGKLILSGQNIMEELFKDTTDLETIKFGNDILCLSEDIERNSSKSGRLNIVGNAGMLKNKTVPYSDTLRKDYYIIENVQALNALPGSNASPFLTFTDREGNAGLFIKNGKSRQAVMSVPFESITDENLRNGLMDLIIDWLEP